MSAMPPGPTELPKVLEQLKEVKSEASELRNFTITFLSLLLYVNLIIAGTDAEQILRVAPVTLPLLNVPLPIIGFYGFLPWLLLFFHLYLLVQHYLFSQQLFRFESALKDASPDEQKYARKNLGNLPFLHWMVGRHGAALSAVLTLITLMCLMVWPLGTLLWLQMAILPYHSEILLAWQRVALVLDVLLVGWLWPKTLDRGDSSFGWWACALACLPVGFTIWRDAWCARNTWQGVKQALRTRLPDVWLSFNAGLLGGGLLLALFLSLLVATLPDSWEDRQLRRLPTWLLASVAVDNKGNPEREAFFLTAKLHEQHAKSDLSPAEFDELVAKGAKACPVSERPKNTASGCLMVQPPLPRNLILREKVLTADAALKPELEAKLQAGAAEAKPEDLAQIRGLDLQNRNFDYADFSESSLPKADLRYASLKFAVLRNARFDGAQMQHAHLDRVNLTKAKLPGANLSRAELSGAELFGTEFSSADLSSANLAVAQLILTTLRGADLSDSNLPGVNFFEADLSGANLSGAEMHNAGLFLAHLPGAVLRVANLTGAVFLDADLTGADLSDAELVGANLSSAGLAGADLSRARLPGVDLSEANLQGADLRIEASPLTADTVRQTAEIYRQALVLRPEYQGQQGQKALDEAVNKFEQRIKRPPDFSSARQMKPCLHEIDAGGLLPDCVAVESLNQSSRQAFAKVWLRLACEDKTTGRWVARRMVDRAKPYFVQFLWFAKALQQAAQNPKTCPGLAGLPEDYKARLQALPSKYK